MTIHPTPTGGSQDGADDPDGAASTASPEPPLSYSCTCGEVFRAESSEDLLRVVDEHADNEHPPLRKPPLAQESLTMQDGPSSFGQTSTVRSFVLEIIKDAARDERTKVLLTRAGRLLKGALVAELTRRRGQTSRKASFEPSGNTPPLGIDEDVTQIKSAYPTAPQPLQLTMQGAGYLIHHTDLSDLWVEVTMTGFSEFALAIEWQHRTPRIFYTASEIPSAWTAVRHDDFAIPLELKRVGQTTVMCRWLAPCRKDLREQMARPRPGPVDPAAAARRIQTALDHLGETGSTFQV